MKRISILITLSLLIASTALFAQMSGVSTEKSTIKWTGSKVGGSHNGSLQLKEAKLDMHDNHLHGGQFTIDMTSIVNLDIKKKKNKTKLENHLKSDDFFGVASFPEAVLKITEEASFKDGVAHIHADLTIKGKTHPVHFEAKKDGKKITATIKVDRSKYNVRYGSKSFFDNLGNKMIDNEFVIEVSLSLI